MTAAQVQQIKGLLLEQRGIIERLLPLLPRLRTLFRDQGHTEAARVHNVLEFAVLYGYDFNCILEDTVEHQGTRRGLVYARFLILLVYEASQKLRHLLGRQFQADLRTIGYDDRSIATARSIHKCFVETFEQCNIDFGEVRNGIIAHRDASSERQIELIEQADVQSVVDMTIQMESCVVQLSAMLAIHLENQLASLRPEGAGSQLHKPGDELIEPSA